MNFYRRRLPHWQPRGAQYFITIRLAGTLPSEAIERLKELRTQLNQSDEEFESGHKLKHEINRRMFKRYEAYLDKAATGPKWLGKYKVAKIIKDALHYRDGKIYDLLAYCVMPNHLHMVIDLSDSEITSSNRPVTHIIGRYKSYTAQEANQLLGRKGAFWQSESYDHVIRDNDELVRVVTYTLQNPVKAGLCKKWQNWLHTYLKNEYRPSFE